MQRSSAVRKYELTERTDPSPWCFFSSLWTQVVYVCEIKMTKREPSAVNHFLFPRPDLLAFSPAPPPSSSTVFCLSFGNHIVWDCFLWEQEGAVEGRTKRLERLQHLKFALSTLCMKKKASVYTTAGNISIYTAWLSSHVPKQTKITTITILI